MNNSSTHNPLYATTPNKQFTTRSIPLPPRKNPLMVQTRQSLQPIRRSIPHSYYNNRRLSHIRSSDSLGQYEMYNVQNNFHGLNPLHKEN
jgi:hypothetical protein